MKDTGSCYVHVLIRRQMFTVQSSFVSHSDVLATEAKKNTIGLDDVRAVACFIIAYDALASVLW